MTILFRTALASMLVCTAAIAAESEPVLRPATFVVSLLQDGEVVATEWSGSGSMSGNGATVFYTDDPLQLHTTNHEGFPDGVVDLKELEAAAREAIETFEFGYEFGSGRGMATPWPFARGRGDLVPFEVGGILTEDSLYMWTLRGVIRPDPFAGGMLIGASGAVEIPLPEIYHEPLTAGSVHVNESGVLQVSDPVGPWHWPGVTIYEEEIGCLCPEGGPTNLYTLRLDSFGWWPIPQHFIHQADLDQVLTNWGSVVDGDLVDQSDLDYVLANWGAIPKPAVVPEPSTWGLLVVGLVAAGVLRGRKRKSDREV